MPIMNFKLLDSLKYTDVTSWIAFIENLSSLLLIFFNLPLLSDQRGWHRLGYCLTGNRIDIEKVGIITTLQ